MQNNGLTSNLDKACFPLSLSSLYNTFVENWKLKVNFAVGCPLVWILFVVPCSANMLSLLCIFLRLIEISKGLIRLSFGYFWQYYVISGFSRSISLLGSFKRLHSNFTISPFSSCTSINFSLLPTWLPWIIIQTGKAD